MSSAISSAVERPKEIHGANLVESRRIKLFSGDTARICDTGSVDEYIYLTVFANALGNDPLYVCLTRNTPGMYRDFAALTRHCSVTACGRSWFLAAKIKAASAPAKL